MDIICFYYKHLGDRLGTTKQCEGRERKSQASFNIFLEASSSIQPWFAIQRVLRCFAKNNLSVKFKSKQNSASVVQRCMKL